MQIIKFDDFMKKNYEINKYKDLSDTIIEIAIETFLAIGLALFGFIFLEQFLEMMQVVFPTGGGF